MHLQNGAHRACEAVKFQVFQTDFDQICILGAAGEGEWSQSTEKWPLQLHLFKFFFQQKKKIFFLKVMFNADPINIILVLGCVHTPVHEMWHLLKDLPCYTLILGRQGQHRPTGFRKRL